MFADMLVLHRYFLSGASLPLLSVSFFCATHPACPPARCHRTTVKVEPILEVLVGKTLELSVLELMEASEKTFRSSNWWQQTLPHGAPVSFLLKLFVWRREGDGWCAIRSFAHGCIAVEP